MRTSLIPLLGAALVATPVSLPAQASYSARLGLTAGTVLAKDQIFQPIRVRQGLAPTLALSAGLPVTPRNRVTLELALTSGTVTAEETGQPDRRLGTLRTAAVTLGLDGPVTPQVRWRAGLGVIKYLPATRQDLFRRGGPTEFLVGAGADYQRPVSRRFDLVVSARYDFHRFLTAEMQARNFSQGQSVHRLSLAIGLAGGVR